MQVADTPPQTIPGAANNKVIGRAQVTLAISHAWIARSGAPPCSPLRALTTGLRWSNHEGHEDGIRRAAESNDRLCDHGSLAPRVGTAIWPRTPLSLIPSCSSCASWCTDRPDPLACHGHIPRTMANKSVHRQRKKCRVSFIENGNES